MSIVSTKGWYIQRLKESGITKHDGKHLKQFKTHVVANLYKTLVKGENK